MPFSPTLNLAVRSYAEISAPHQHEFAQLVLPLNGALDIEIEGKGGRLDSLRAAFVTPGARHAQEGHKGNRSLVVDLDMTRIVAGLGEQLASRPFLQITPAASRLIDYMALTLGHPATPGRAEHWTPLLLDALLEQSPTTGSRLAALRVAVEADLARPWTAAAMASHAAMSISRLHALFRSELDTTPAAWLSELRLGWVRQQLATSSAPIAELALLAGYSDQNALTRAMRRTVGQTPGAYRRQVREDGPKLR